MAADLIRYDLLVQHAMRGVMRGVLGEVAARGALPGDHHFMISFRTDGAGVKISRRLAEQWPQEMTIILQHQFHDLVVDEAGFSVTLSFRLVPETLYIPFAAVTAFSDPSVEFGFKFNIEGQRDEAEEPPRPPGPSLVRAEAAPSPAPPKSASATPAPSKPESAPTQPEPAKPAAEKIVSIDAFRKKP